LTFRFDPEDLLRNYVDTDRSASIQEMHRRLALQIKDDWHRNGHVIRGLREAFQIALVLLLGEIMAWMFSIATM
jgi:hypothetical protein